MDRRITRRRFIKNTAALAGTVLLSSCSIGPFAKKSPETAADQVTLGKTGLKLSRLGFGTGSKGGSIHRDLGNKGFTQLLRYAYDQGITYIDTAQNYGTHTMVREAIKGLPREKLFIQSKMPGVPDKPLEVLDRYRKELGVEYIDSLLVHVTIEGDWDESRKRVTDALTEAKDKGIIRAHIKLSVRAVGSRISGSKAAYKYLATMIPRFYPAEELADIMRQAGFEKVTFEKYLFGAVAIHRASKL